MKIKFNLLLLCVLLAELQAQTPLSADHIDAEILRKTAEIDQFHFLSLKNTYALPSPFDVGYLGLDLKLNIPARSLSGSAVIRVRSLVANLMTLDLDLDEAMIVDSVGGAADAFSHVSNRLSLSLNRDFGIGEIAEIDIWYHGFPKDLGRKGLMFGEHEGAPVVASLDQPYYSNTWFPCKDLPEDKIDSVDFSITVPDTLVAVSNGLLAETIRNGDGTATFRWQERYPIANYLIFLAVSKYAYREDIYTGLNGEKMPIQFWIFPENVESAMTTLDLTSDMIRFFSTVFGEYPFIKEKYGTVQFLWSGGMEHQTCTSLGSYGELLIAHELAHQWWGDMITCANWRHIWLNEGFARYAEAYWYEHQNGSESLKGYMDYLNRPSEWNSNRLYVTDTTNVTLMFDRVVYDKGAWVLHMLRKIVGESGFDQILRTYREAYDMSVAQTRDFQRVCESVSGMNLDRFFDEWVYGEGQPHYKFNWRRNRNDDRSWLLALHIDQVQTTSTVFSMPIDVVVKTENGDESLTIWDSLPSQDFTMICTAKPLSIEIDPGSWILKSVSDVTVDPDVGEFPDDISISEPFPNPFNQSVAFQVYLPRDFRGALTVVDLTGRKIDEIQTGRLKAGNLRQSWTPDGISSGLYFIRLEGSGIFKQQKVVYLK
ncbi:MAG: M1 family aminopeptidase [Candidatus Neomarinimicrobiota bacterium]